jgi:hypothetical protein
MQGRQGPGEENQDSSDHSATSGYRLSDLLGRSDRSATSGFRLSDLNGRSDRSATGSFRLSDLTGEREAVIPQRPPHMAYLDEPPPTRRVARPQQRENKIRRPRTWAWWLGRFIIVSIAAVIIGAIAFGITNFFFAVSVSQGAANTAVDFLSNLQNTTYDQAYDDLNATITFQMSASTFTKMAQADDHCYGPVTHYAEVSSVATNSSNVNIMSFAYTITRSKLAKPYQLNLTLQKDSTGTWTITDYGTDLGPAPPTC